MKSQTLLWLNELLAQIIEGATDSFLILTGGSALAQSGAVDLPAVSLKQLSLSVALGGLIYAASFLKKYPVPSRFPVPVPTAPLPAAAPNS